MCYGIVYCLTNTVNGKLYIGQTTASLDDRWFSHVSMSKNKRKQLVLTRAIAKHSESSFTRVVLHECNNQEELDTLEIRSILEMKTLVPNGYNVREGGWGGKLSIETRNKISTVLKGGKLSAETKKKMSQRMTGTKLSENTKKKISEKAKGKRTWNTGRTLSIEHRGNISRAKKGRKFTEEHKQKLRDARAKFLKIRTEKRDAEVLSHARAVIEKPIGD